TLREVGGTEGVGVAFLEETFAASTAPPQHQLHQKAAQGVLKALLPEAGTDMKGHMRSQQDLLQGSGYDGRPRDFDELLRIVDGGQNHGRLDTAAVPLDGVQDGPGGPGRAAQPDNGQPALAVRAQEAATENAVDVAGGGGVAYQHGPTPSRWDGRGVGDP